MWSTFSPVVLQYQVQRKRFNELERAKKSEILEKLKAERELSKEIVNTLRMSATGGFDASQTLKTRGSSTKGSSKGTSKVSNLWNTLYYTPDADSRIVLDLFLCSFCLFSLRTTGTQGMRSKGTEQGGFFVTDGNMS